MKPPVEAPTSRAVSPFAVDLEPVQRCREFVAAASDVWIGLVKLDRSVARESIAGFDVPPRGIALADAHFAGHHEGLGLGPGVRQSALDEQFIEPLLGPLAPGVG